MPKTCCKADYDAVFDARMAHRQLGAYQRDGPTGATHRLVEGIVSEGVGGATVLDIGGGIGVIGMELLAAGADHLTDVDAASAYVKVARQEAERRGFGARTTVLVGDFTELAHAIDPADIVTLDRVVCCYGDWPALVDASVARARRLYGLVFPNDRWWMRVGIGIGNFGLGLFGKSFRGYVHPERAIDRRIRDAGFEPRLHHRGWLWQTILYTRVKTG